MDALLALDIDEELLATCGALGYTEDDQYYKGEECWGTKTGLLSLFERISRSIVAQSA